MAKNNPPHSYANLVQDIGSLLEEGRSQAYRSVNNILLQTYWGIGQQIVEFEQKGKQKAEYGSKLILRLAKDLKLRFGKGFSRSNIYSMRQLYLHYPNIPDAFGILTWSHYFELLKIENNAIRSFYEQQCLKDKWSVRELKRQKNSMLYERLLISKTPKEILKLSQEGQVVKSAKDIVKNPYILEFLGVSDSIDYSEKDFEQHIIDNLQLFLLELGKGFAFVQRQFRISFGDSHFYVDLVFYHRILKCFVLIDLKVNEVKHTDIGQMNLYLNYFAAEESVQGDNPPIGIVLGNSKDELKMEYALGGITNNLFVSKYQLYLPNKEQLEAVIRKSWKE